VRRGFEGETIKLLDQREVGIDPGFLVIADAREPVGLAGIMGGWNSRVTDATTKVFLEAAHFAPDAIVGRARKLGMHTDAAHRFERGVDPELPPQAIERATSLILSIAGGKAGPMTEAHLANFDPSPPTVTLRRDRLARVLGMHVADAEVERILRALGMQVERVPETPVRFGPDLSEGYLSEQQVVREWRVLPPTSRFDIAIEEDLIEEIARIHGYEAIPTAMPSGEIRVAAITELRVPDADIRRQLAARDYREAINYAFVDAGLLATWSLDADAVALANPLSADLGAMRTSLLPGLVQALARNTARQQSRVRLFELGRVFGRRESGIVHSDSSKPDAGAPIETLRVAAVACGSAGAEQWGDSARTVDFHDLKGDLESVAGLAGYDIVAGLRYLPATETWLHPGRSAEVWREEQRLGWIGHLHPRLLKALDLDADVLVFELDLEPLAARDIPVARPLSRYPLVRRDLALVVPDSVPWAAVEASLRAALGPLLREVRLFDVYRGTGLDPDTRSVAMGLILQDVSRTLTDHDADGAVAAAVAALERDCGAVLRGG
jgi:phenylalanyl-tRNA synthetase beta chain